MTSSSFRKNFINALLALAAGVLVASCGGGGATATQSGGSVQLQPINGTFYAGVPSRITVSGGRPPYAMSSSEPQIIEVPAEFNGHFLDVIPNNPGVVDTGLQPGELPRRTVNISARDTTGITVATAIQVGQNFLTGYGLTLQPSACPAGVPVPPDGVTGGQAFSGCSTAFQMNATFNGSLHGNQQFTFQVIRGNFALRHPVTGQVSSSITVNSDHTGSVLGIIEATAGAPTQLAVIRTIHVPTGVYMDTVFTINGPDLSGTLTAIPPSLTFTGVLSNQCGTGTQDFLVFDGTPPYTATVVHPNINVNPSSSNTEPGRFSVTVTNPTICLTDQPIVVQDSVGRRVVVNVSSEVGSAAPPPVVPFNVSPNTMTLACGAQGSASIVGGSGNYTVNSNHPRVFGFLFGNTVSVVRQTGDGAVVYPTTAIVSVTDGATIQNITVTVPANCGP